MTQERAPSPGTRVARAALSQVGERESEVSVRDGGKFQRRRGHQIRADPRLLDHREHRVHGRTARVLGNELAESLIRTPRYVRAGERFADRREVARREPWTQHRGDEVAGLEAASLAVEVMAGRVLDIAAGLCDTRNFDERIPLAARQRDDHYAAAVARLEVVADGAIEIITVLGLVASTEFSLPDA